MTTPRRRREWEDNFIDEAGTTAETDEALLIDVTESNKGKTLVRMIIDLAVLPTSIIFNSTDVMELNLGIGLVSSEVVTGSINVGISGELPQSGWLWRRRLLVMEAGNAGLIKIDADIRSQRKLLYGEPRLFLSYALEAGTSFNVSVTGLIRCLYLMP